MTRRTRSIVLVLLGTGFTGGGCDERRDRVVTPLPAEPDAPSTRPADPADGGRYGPLYGYGPMVHTGRPGVGWIGGVGFAPRRYGGPSGGSLWADGESSRAAAPSRARSPSISRSSSAESSASGHGTTFGGFGAHASAAHAGS